MRIMVIAFLLSLNLYAEKKLHCQGYKVCLQSENKNQIHFTEPIKYEQSKNEAIKLLQTVLNTLGLEIIKVDTNHIKALKESSFFKVKTHIAFNLSQAHFIRFVAHSDSPKLDWGDTGSLIEKIKFRFYQNNM